MPELIDEAPTEPPEHPYPKAVMRYPRVRQSLLSTFDQCSLLTKFDMEYRDGWSNHPAARGQIFHRFAAKAMKAMYDEGESTMEPVVGLEILRECLRQHDVDARDVVNLPFSQIKDLRWVVIKWCDENVFDMEHLASIEERLEAEVSYHHDDYGNLPRRLSGQLDVLFFPQPDWAVVLDWKDTWALPRQSDLSDSGYFQQRFYALLVMHRYPAIQRVTLREFYVRYSEPREATIFRSELPNIEEEMAALVERFDRAMQEGHYPLPDPSKAKDDAEKLELQREQRDNLWKPSPGAHCSYCPRPGICPIFPDARVQGAITNAEQAERWAAEQIVAKAAVKQRDEGLRAWATTNGPVPIAHAKDPDRVLGYTQTKRTARPTKEELERALVEQGAELDPNTLYREQTTTTFKQHTREVTDEAADVSLVAALEESLAQQQDKES